MATHFFSLSSDLNYDYTKLAVVGGVARLRKIDAFNNYDPAGRYYSSYIDTAIWSAQGIENFVGISLIADIPSGSSVFLQVSLDGGNNFLYWDGANWVISSQRNTIDEIASGISTLSSKFTGKKEVMLRIYLDTDADGTVTPSVFGVLLYATIRMSYWDDLAISLVQYINNTYTSLISTTLASSSSGQNAFVFKDIKHNVSDVVGAWNHNTDPYHLNNILSSWQVVGNDLQVTTTVPFNAGEFLWVDFLGLPKRVHVKFSDPLIEVSEVPAILIIPVGTAEHRYQESRDFDYMYDSFNEVYHVSKPALSLISEVLVMFVSNNAKECYQMSDGVLDYLDRNTKFLSNATGEVYEIVRSGMLTNLDAIDDTLTVKRLRISVSGTKVYYKTVEIPSIKSINVDIGSFKEKWQSFSIQ